MPYQWSQEGWGFSVWWGCDASHLDKEQSGTFIAIKACTSVVFARLLVCDQDYDYKGWFSGLGFAFLTDMWCILKCNNGWGHVGQKSQEIWSYYGGNDHDSSNGCYLNVIESTRVIWIQYTSEMEIFNLFKRTRKKMAAEPVWLSLVRGNLCYCFCCHHTALICWFESVTSEYVKSWAEPS